jgi:VRR-NUC domain
MPPITPRPAPKPTEGDVRRSIEIALNKQGIVRVFLNAQYSGPARGGHTRAGLGTGTADLIGYALGTGRFFALEVKTNKGRASDEQEAWIAQTNREGGYAAIARTPEEACEHAWKASKGA